MCTFKNECNSNNAKTKKITKFLGIMPFSTLLWRSNPVQETSSTLIPREEVVGPTTLRIYASQIDLTIDYIRDNYRHHQLGIAFYHDNSSRVHTIDNYSNANDELHVATSLGNVARVKELVGLQKELIKTKNSVGNLALHVAVEKGHKEVAKYLIREFPQGSYDFNHRGRSPLYIAVEKGKNDIVEYMLGNLRGDSKVIHSLIKDHSLSIAITSQSLEMVKIILKHQPKLLNSTNQEGYTPLSHAAYTGAADIVDYILEKFPEAVVKDKSYPIHRACQGGHVHVLQKFELRCHRKIFTKPDPSGLNVLHHAASAPGNQLKHVVDFLLSLRCRTILVNMPDETNRTPFELARCSQNDEVMELFDRYLH